LRGAISFFFLILFLIFFFCRSRDGGGKENEHEQDQEQESLLTSLPLVAPAWRRRQWQTPLDPTDKASTASGFCAKKEAAKPSRFTLNCRMDFTLFPYFPAAGGAQ
jgi:hypothetical protein